MKKSLNSKKTAYHEAGHATARYFLKLAFKYVTIEPNKDSLGHVKPFPPPDSFQPDTFDDSRTRTRIEKQIIAYYAGHAAEFVLTGRKNWSGASSDNHNAVNLAHYYCGSETQASLFLAWMWQRTVDWIKLPYHWKAVEALAKELIIRQRLSSKDAKKVIAKALPRL